MSNILVSSEFRVLHQTQNIRMELMNVLTDTDLAYKLPGDNVTLGALCRQMGEVEQMYIDSFKTFKMDWTYGTSDPALATSVAKLKEWYHALDQQFDAAVEHLSDDDVHKRTIDRGGFMPNPHVQLHVYREALLIFYGKATCYLRAMQKPLPQQMGSWIG